MSKTREKVIEVWVDKDLLSAEGFRSWPVSTTPLDMPMVKAKLIIELPEKSVSISETEWEEVRNVWDTDKTVAKNLTAMKEKLFSKGQG